MKETNCMIGIDLGGTKIEIILLDLSGKELLRKRIKTPINDYPNTLTSISNLIFEFEKTGDYYASVGIGIPGKISQNTNLIEYANSTYLIGKPLIKDLEKNINRKIKVENDANCFALSEYVDGSANNANSLFAAILGTGVGGGIIINGDLVQGINSSTGEWGHNRLPWSNDLEIAGQHCYCGLLGCIETFLSGAGLQKSFFKFSKIHLSVEEIVDLSLKNNDLALKTLKLYEIRLAKSLSMVINVLDPEIIVLGGGLSNIDRIYDNVPPLLNKYVISDSVATKLVKAKYGDSSGVRGAAWL
jgi:fructokinase